MVENVDGIFDVLQKRQTQQLSPLDFQKISYGISGEKEEYYKRVISKQFTETNQAFLSNALQTIEKPALNHDHTTTMILTYNMSTVDRLHAIEDDETCISFGSEGEDSDDQDSLSSCSSSGGGGGTAINHHSHTNEEKAVLEKQVNYTGQSNLDTQCNEEDYEANNWIGVLNEQEMILYPPHDIKHLKKESIVNLMDVAEQLECQNVYVYLDRNNEHAKEFARAFVYAGFEMISPVCKKLNSKEWLVFASEL